MNMDVQKELHLNGVAKELEKKFREILFHSVLYNAFCMLNSMNQSGIKKI